MVSLGGGELGKEALTVLRDKPQLLATPHGEEGQLRPCSGVRDDVLDGRLGRGDPAVTVLAEAARVVQVHLDEVLVEAVGAAAPPTVAVDEQPVGELQSGPKQAWERLAQCRLRAEEV